METAFKISKILNNNVIIARNPEDQELVLIGKGIGFGKTVKETIDPNKAEKLYILTDKTAQSRYQQVIKDLDESFIGLINSIIEESERALGTTFNERIHVALTDHLAFTIQRLNQGLDVHNPFVEETKILYPKVYEVAEKAVERINKAMDITLPEGEKGFIALHFHSASSNPTKSSINSYSQLVNQMVQLIERDMQIILERNSMNYLQLIQHIRHIITRIDQGEESRDQEKLAEVLKVEYPLCYNLAWKLINVMQQVLGKPVSESEAVYLTLHLQRLSPK